jgi:hypothetical protein
MGWFEPSDLSEETRGVLFLPRNRRCLVGWGLRVDLCHGFSFILFHHSFCIYIHSLTFVYVAGGFDSSLLIRL